MLQAPEGVASPAQCCNDDVLQDVLSHLPQHDLAAAALACRSWLAPARSVLYHRIDFDLKSPNVSKLETTLRNCGHLRSLIRHLRLHHETIGPTYFAEFGWMASLPAHSLRSIDFAFFTELHRLDEVLAFPAVLTAQHIIIRSAHFTTSARLSRVLAMPGLTSLSLTSDASSPEITAALKLGRLTMITNTLPDVLFRIVRSIDPTCTLEQFDLVVGETLAEDRLDALLEVLGSHMTTLKHLSITSRIQLYREPFFDDLVRRLSSLQTLYCGYGSYSSSLLSRLPPTVHTLGLVWGIGGYRSVPGHFGQGRVSVPAPGNVPFPCDDFAVAIAQLRTRSERIRLRRVVLVRPDLMTYDTSVLEQACHNMGLEFWVENMTEVFPRMMD